MSPTKTHLGGGIEVLNLCEGCVKGVLVGSGFTKFRAAARNGAASVLHKMGVVVGCSGAVVHSHCRITAAPLPHHYRITAASIKLSSITKIVLSL
jgi:hypothetical protein